MVQILPQLRRNDGFGGLTMELLKDILQIAMYVAFLILVVISIPTALKYNKAAKDITKLVDDCRREMEE